MATHFRDTPFTAAFCSPLQRTRQTARAILDHQAGAPALLVLPFLTDPDALRAAWTALLARAAGLRPDATALVVTSNGIARFLPDVVGRTPADLDRKLKTGAWGTVQISGAETCILDWNVRP